MKILKIAVWLFLLISKSALCYEKETNEEKFLYNDGVCEKGHFFDENNFKCKFCDPNFNLVVSTDESENLKIES